ncbi:NAC domain-containing protein 2 [Oryza brachyantha]|uniref:NAC domain-containing protein 2 n=1 Tax=Oryza brachyantha TaxID=4533 RepID=UPI001ADD4A5C|nr:NAC domain-containing protein 2 [Oryza brachyantha]
MHMRRGRAAGGEAEAAAAVMSRYENSGHVVAAGGGGNKAAAGEEDGHEDDLVMPGFRFHPTEEELIEFYLRRKVEGKRFNVELITFLDLYRYDPWELPAMAAIGEKEWFFYVPRDRKYRNGDRPNRVTASGYWKATGADRMIRAENNRPIGLKKTLVFYSGKAPKGVRSSWIMNEYRLPPADTDRYHKTEISLCRVYKRTGIDDGHGHICTARSAQSRGRGATTQDNKQGSSSTSTPTPPPTPSKLHLLNGECTSPPAIVTDHVLVHKAPSPRQQQQQQLRGGGGGGGYLQQQSSMASAAQTAAVDQQLQQDVAAALYHQYSKNTNSTFASTYSLLNLVSAASMGSSAAAIDELSSLVGHDQPSYLNPAGSYSQFIPLPTTPSSQPTALGTMSLAAISDKIWDWNNPTPEAGSRDYSAAGFK